MTLFDGRLMEPESQVPLTDWPPDYAEQFWNLYPRKVGKLAAMRALDKVKRDGTTFADLMYGLSRFVQATRRSDPKFICHPRTWLSQGRWLDKENPDSARPGGFAGVLYDLCEADYERHGDHEQTVDAAATGSPWSAGNGSRVR